MNSLVYKELIGPSTTQIIKNMDGCETSGHSSLAWGSQFLQNKKLDWAFLLENPKLKNLNIEFEYDKDFFGNNWKSESDHIPIAYKMKYNEKFMYYIISWNTEGFCLGNYANEEKQEKRINNLRSFLEICRENPMNGFICLQEILLQSGTKDDLKIIIKFILDILNKQQEDRLQKVWKYIGGKWEDGYISAIFYNVKDSSLIKYSTPKRSLISPFEDSKNSSNIVPAKFFRGYTDYTKKMLGGNKDSIYQIPEFFELPGRDFDINETDFLNQDDDVNISPTKSTVIGKFNLNSINFILINIHLKAPSITYSSTYTNSMHTNELLNIFIELLKFEYDPNSIYMFIGDFNNPNANKVFKSSWDQFKALLYPLHSGSLRVGGKLKKKTKGNKSKKKTKKKYKKRKLKKKKSRKKNYFTPLK